MRLNALLVEDSAEDMAQFRRDLPETIQGCHLTYEYCDTFEEAFKKIETQRFDLVLSDTYMGPVENQEAEAIKFVKKFRAEGRFSPLIIFSAGAQPLNLETSIFVRWIDKADLEGEIESLLETNIPQMARKIHDDLDGYAGSYLWEFLEKEWDNLNAVKSFDSEVLNRLIRRRAAHLLAEISGAAGTTQREDVDGLEFYIYPTPEQDWYSLGEIVNQTGTSEHRVILTPHCLLFPQGDERTPKAKFILTVKTVIPADAIGEEEIRNARDFDPPKKKKKVKSWTRAQPGGLIIPEDRFWYLPKFLKIPHLYCDFLQVESIPYKDLRESYESLAIISPPFAESLQASFSTFYSSVGIPNLRVESVMDLIEPD